MGRGSGHSDKELKPPSKVAREGMRRRARAYKARQKGKPKSEAHRAGNRRRNKLWKEKNPEHVAALDREKTMRHHYKYHEENKAKMRTRAAARWAAMTVEQRRDRALRANYGISLDDFKDLLTRQGNVCAACGTDDPGKRGWMVDHCHKRGHVRGILCHHCNAGLGHAKESIPTLRKWIEYIEIDGVFVSAKGE